MWNPSTCKCDKYCGTGQYLDYDNCACRKNSIDYLIEQCTSIADIDLYKKKSSKINVYFILFIIFLVLCVLLIIGLIYHYKNSNKKILNKMYNIVYSCNKRISML